MYFIAASLLGALAKSTQQGKKSKFNEEDLRLFGVGKSLKLLSIAYSSILEMYMLSHIYV